MFIVEISFRHKIGVILAAAVRANVAVAIGARMEVATLTEFRAARVFFAEGPPRVVIHALRQFLFLSKSSLKRLFLFSRTLWELPV